MDAGMDETPAGGPVEQGVLDRLADGDLAEADRRAALLRLDAEPGGWRRCALAFLEAQAWRESFAGVVVAPPLPAAPPLTELPRQRPGRRRGAARAAGLAAGLAAAFYLGHAWNDGPPAPPAGGSGPPRAEVADTTPRPPTPPSAAAAPATEVADTALRRAVEAWERKGYVADVRPGQVAVKLRDGRTVAVPAREVRLRPAGRAI